MSSPTEPSDKSKPVVRAKNPHNYRKVGYSMIIISVSLVLIGLLVWSIGSNYHFASNIMASQEIDTMTPKTGYQIVLFDYTQPIGGKLKLLDHADSMDTAQELKNQYEKQNAGGIGQVLIFGISAVDNLNLMANAEVAAMTPKQGYNVISFNTALPVGAKLALGIHEMSLDNATKYQQLQEDQNKDPDVKYVIFTSSFTDNLKIVTGSSTPVGAFATLTNEQTSITPSTSQTAGNPTTEVANASAAAARPLIVGSNHTGANVEKTSINVNASITSSKSVTVNEKVDLNTTTSGK